MLQCIAESCSVWWRLSRCSPTLVCVLQCVAVCCSVSHNAAVRGDGYEHARRHWCACGSVLQCVAVCRRVSQSVAVCGAGRQNTRWP